jgi:hypothetical protein
MSETARTLIKGALRVVGALASGETPTADEENEALEALKFMFRSWSTRDIMLFYVKQDTVTLTGANYYTIGSGGDCNTVRPTSIRGAYVDDQLCTIIDEAKHRELRLSNLTGSAAYLYYNPEYPLGKIYLLPTDGSLLYLDSLKPLTDPTAITGDVAFPPEYDAAIKYGLAVHLAPEYGKEASPTVLGLAQDALAAIVARNFASQIVNVRLNNMC